MSPPDVIAVHPPDVIVLNGTSSAGKTCLARALQEALDGCYLRASLDAFFDMLPPKAFTAPDLVHIFECCESGFYRCVPALVGAGNRVIVDTVLDSPGRAAELAGLLRPFRTLYVGVHCPLAELERRERARGDREAGLAAHQLERVHGHLRYDVEVDTLACSPEQCAAQVRAHLSAPA